MTLAKMPDRIEPRDQYQVGDEVVLIRWGILTEVIGYLWGTGLGPTYPDLVAYRLSCGVDALAGDIEPYTGPRLSPSRGREATPDPAPADYSPAEGRAGDTGSDR